MVSDRPQVCGSTPQFRHRTVAMLATVFALAGMPRGSAQEPLHVRIDRIVDEAALGAGSNVVTDNEFVRRVYLDFTGAVPSIHELRAFMADTSPNKRVQLVERLLSSPQYIRHMVTTLDVMLMERRPSKHIKQEEWEKYLSDSIAQNKPWHQLAREILGADGTDEKIRPAARFYLDREAEPNLLTRDVGRVFFGMDLACCQCHDHPLISTYLQFDYYGIYAFLSRGTLFADKEKKVFYAEKAEGDVKFSSVFTKKQDEIRPRLPGEFEIDEPVFFKGEEYSVAPADGVRPVPKFSRRAVLAEQVGSGKNRMFALNIVNRLWAQMMGRGLVEPLDMHHAGNPATHPELLNILADEFTRMNFDIRAFLRELALTKVYQRSSSGSESVIAASPGAAQQLASLQNQLASVSQTHAQTSAAADQSLKSYDESRSAVTAALAEFAKANDAIGAAQKAVADATKALTDAQQQLAMKKDVAAAVQDAATKATEAAGRLPHEKELAAAAEIFNARATQFASELVAAEKLVADRTPPATSAADALNAAKNTAAPLLEKLNAARQKSNEIRQTLGPLQQRLQAEEWAVRAVEARMAIARSITRVAETFAQADASRKQVTGIENQITAGKQTAVALNTQLPQLESAMNAAKTASDEATKMLAEAQASLIEKQQAVMLVGETLAKSEVAVQKLPQDVELKKAAESLKTRHGQLGTEAEQLKTVASQREQTAKTTSEQYAVAQQALGTARTQLETLQKSIPALEAQLPEARNKAADDEAASIVEERNNRELWRRSFLAAPLEPLTPEQMAWSMLKVTGVVDQHRAAGEAEVSKTLPLDPNAPPDAAKLAEREKKIEQFVYDKLKGNVATFVTLFGHAGGQPQRDFFATVDQPLFFANAGVLQSWLNPNGDNLLGRLGKLSDPRQVADELYMAVLCRPPAEEELAAVATYLESRTNDRPAALQEMAWALITSAEFRFQ